ncbi:MAG: zinc-binding dehydrogenase [Candidatus Eremiobacteraeota bacterium]|nr:zinc-binding dehydrogenase [Candidatus Eremiobacteraeota bacterium]
MLVAYLVAPRQIELRDDVVPQPQPGGVIVRVRVALTDGTDLKAFRRGHPRMPMPTRFGHEFSGDVAAIGDGVAAFRVGDSIACVHSAPCGECFWCRHAEEELCESVMPTMILGAYAQFIAVPPNIVARNAFPKPKNLTYEAAAFLEPLSCVVHSLDTLAPQSGAALLVIGDGAFGILHGAVAQRRYGCSVILAGRHTERLQIAREFGIDRVIDVRNSNDEALLAAVLERTEGRGADGVIECTGSEAVWSNATRFVRRGGTVVLFGGLPPNARPAFDAFRLHYDEVKLVSPFHFTPRAVRVAYEMLTAEHIDVTRLISGRYSLSDVSLAFAELERGHGLKYAIVP